MKNVLLGRLGGRLVTWVLVANRAGAHLYRVRKRLPATSLRNQLRALELVQEIENPQGRLKAGQINSDKPGRVFSNATMERHGLSQQESPCDHVTRRFAHELADILERGRVDHEYDQLVLVASPDVLGLLRGALSVEAHKLVTATLDKNISTFEEKDRPKSLSRNMAKSLARYLGQMG